MLRHAYEKRFKRSMDQTVQGELSFKTKDAFNIALQGRWQDNGYVDHNMVQSDVHQLGSAFRLGFTDEMLIASIIFARSPKYLQALTGAFQQAHGKTLVGQIEKHFTGHLQDALVHAAKAGLDGTGVLRDAEALEAAMAGAGTKVRTLADCTLIPADMCDVGSAAGLSDSQGTLGTASLRGHQAGLSGAVQDL